VRKVVIFAGIVIVAVIAAVAAGLLLRTTSHLFVIVEDNFEVGFDYDEELNVLVTETVYVKVKNEGIDGTDIVVCEITRSDLSKIKKTRNVFLRSGETKVVDFVFSNADLRGSVPKGYDVWIS